MRLRRDRNSSASRSRAVLSPFPLFLPRSTSQGLQAGEVSRRPHRFGRERGREGREPAYVLSENEKTHPFGVGLVFV